VPFAQDTSQSRQSTTSQVGSEIEIEETELCICLRVAELEPLQVLIFLPLTFPIPQRVKSFVGSNTLEKHVLHCPFQKPHATSNKYI
jgi:hypothetical protein